MKAKKLYYTSNLQFLWQSTCFSIRKIVANLNKRKSSNFKLYYKYKGKKSYLILFMYKHCLVDIQYICNIKKISLNSKNYKT